jgi:beta-carotene hydroxylase
VSATRRSDALYRWIAEGRLSRAAWSRATRSRALARVYRYPVDVFPTAIMGGIFAGQLAVFLCVDSPLRAAVAVTLLFPIQVNFAGMCHNHHHLETFRHRLLNRAFEVMMFLQLGMLPYGYTLHHNIGHHAHYLEPERDPNRWRREDGSTMGPWEFAWRLFVNMYPTVIRIGREHPAIFRRFLGMFGVCMAALVTLVAIDPVNALLVFVAPLPPALYLQAYATYYQHVGLTDRDPLLASRSALDRLYNLRTGNLGYHTAHHLRPALHWSRLPGFHDEIADRIPRDRIL